MSKELERAVAGVAVGVGEDVDVGVNTTVDPKRIRRLIKLYVYEQ